MRQDSCFAEHYLLRIRRANQMIQNNGFRQTVVIQASSKEIPVSLHVDCWVHMATVKQLPGLLFRIGYARDSEFEKSCGVIT